MRRFAASRSLSAVAACLLLAACSEASDSPVESDTAPLFAAAGRPDAGQPVFYWMSDQQVAGATSSLVRTPNGVNFRLSTRDLQAGHAYTLWIVIFNNPAGCEHGMPGATSCGAADVVNDAARPDMMYAAGAIAGAAGRLTFAGHRRVGDTSGSANLPVGLPAYALESPAGAEVHLVVHHHGPAIAAFLPDMIHTIDGGCTDTGVPEAGAPSPWNLYSGPAGVGAFGRRGPNTCASVQAAAHMP